MTFEVAWHNPELQRVVLGVCEGALKRRGRRRVVGVELDDLVSIAWTRIWHDWEKLRLAARLPGAVAMCAGWAAERELQRAFGRSAAQRGPRSQRDGSRGGTGRVRGYLEKFQCHDDDSWERLSGLCVSRELPPPTAAHLRELAESIGRPEAVEYLCGGDPPERLAKIGRYGATRMPNRPAWGGCRRAVEWAMDNPGLVWVACLLWLVGWFGNP